MLLLLDIGLPTSNPFSQPQKVEIKKISVPISKRTSLGFQNSLNQKFKSIKIYSVGLAVSCLLAFFSYSAISIISVANYWLLIVLPDVTPLSYHSGPSDLNDIWSDYNIQDSHFRLHGVSVELTHVGPTIL